MKLTQVLLCSGAICVATTAFAAESSAGAKFASGKLLVLDASSYVNPPSGAFKSNQELTLTRKQLNPPGGNPGPVAVRIFSLHPGEKVPTQWAVFEPCWVYLSTLLQVKLNPSGSINLFSLSKEWLTAVKGEPMKSAHYLLVFEQGGGDGHGLIRLNGADRADYFRRGLRIEVEPSRAFTQAEVDQQAAQDKLDAAKVKDAARVNDAKATCYITRLADAGAADAADGSPVALALSDDCDPAMLAL